MKGLRLGPNMASLRHKGAVRISPRAPHPCCSPAHIFHRWPRQSHQGSQGCRHTPGSHQCSIHCCSGTGRAGSCPSTLDGGEVTLRHRAGARGPASTWPSLSQAHSSSSPARPIRKLGRAAGLGVGGVRCLYVIGMVGVSQGYGRRMG